MTSSSSTITKTSTLILSLAIIFLIFLTQPNAGQLQPSVPIGGVNINTMIVNGNLTCSPTLVGPGAPLANTTVTISSNGIPLVSAITDPNGNLSANIPINSLLPTLPGAVLTGLTASVTAPIAGCGLTTSVNPGTVLPLPLNLRSITGSVLNLTIGGLLNPLLPVA